MPVVTPRRRSLAVLTGVALLVVIAVAIIQQVKRSHPPITLADAGISGQVWTMPADRVQPFLRAHGVDALPPAVDGAAVVARVEWSPDLAAGTFTVVLGDERARSGVIHYVYGPPQDSVTLGNGSMWDDALAEHDWLVGDGTQQDSSGGYSSFGQFASVPSDWSGPVWVVGHVVTPPKDSNGIAPAPVSDPQPVVGVALSSGSQVWWIEEVARS